MKATPYGMVYLCRITLPASSAFLFLCEAANVFFMSLAFHRKYLRRVLFMAETKVHEKSLKKTELTGKRSSRRHCLSGRGPLHARDACNKGMVSCRIHTNSRIRAWKIKYSVKWICVSQIRGRHSLQILSASLGNQQSLPSAVFWTHIILSGATGYI